MQSQTEFTSDTIIGNNYSNKKINANIKLGLNN